MFVFMRNDIAQLYRGSAGAGVGFAHITQSPVTFRIRLVRVVSGISGSAPYSPNRYDGLMEEMVPYH
jgi:hypothetical protein